MTQVSSLYLHVPFCQHLCNYCDFYKKPLDSHRDQFLEYQDFLKNSVSQHEKFLLENNFSWAPLETVYLGGGTPSLWGKKGAEFFSKELSSAPLKDDAEFTMEVDPGTWTEEMLSAWQEVGLNRISVGTQSLNPEFLKILDRIHSLNDSLYFLKFLQKNNWNYSLDFLLGVPFSHEKKRDIKQELDLLLDHSPKHISLYILNARSKYPHIQHIPDDDYISEEYLFVSEYLRSLGFHHYEVSNFALPGFESKHNQKYWNGQSVAALGPTGTGYLAINDNKAIRYKWKVTKPEVEIEELGPTELTLEKTYLSLRTSLGLKITPERYPLYLDWIEKNYATEDNGIIKLNSSGFLILDSLMKDLL